MECKKGVIYIKEIFLFNFIDVFISFYIYLNADKEICATLTESMEISPICNSTNLNNPAKSELLPAPVLPTTPIFSAGLVSNDTPFNAGVK